VSLISLIYVSSALEKFGTAELTRILESAVRHNTAQSVTGMLLYFDGNFMQALEGEEAAVDETYSRIRQDPRHTGCIVIDRSLTEGRNFSQWSMGFKCLDASDLLTHPAYAALLRGDLDAAAVGAKEGIALKLLRRFASRQRD
jgi:hypothetical protein